MSSRTSGQESLGWNSGQDGLEIGDSSGTLLRASTYLYSPFVVESSHEGLTGPFVDTLHTLCLDLHYRCILKLAEYGTSTNDSLNSVFGDLTREMADIGISASTITQQRHSQFDIVPSPFYRTYQIVIDRSNTFSDSSGAVMYALTSLFTADVWTLLAVVNLTFITTFVLTASLRRIFVGRNLHLIDEVGFWSMKLIGAATYNCDMKASKQIWPSRSTFSAQSILIAVWLVYIVLITTVFQSRLPVMLASGDHRYLPFDSLENLEASDFELYGTANMKTLFEMDSKLVFRKLGARMQKIYSPPENFTRIVVDHIKTGRVAFMISEENGLDLAAISCDVIIAIPSMIPRPIAGLVFRKNSPLRRQFEIRYVSLRQTGIIQHFDRTFQNQIESEKKINKCFPKPLPNKPMTRYVNLTFNALTFLYKFYSILLGCALLAFLMEKLYTTRN